jgi:hypothetical protein
MAVRFTPGAVLRLPLPDGKPAYAVMLATFPYLAFYADDPGLAEGHAPAGEPIFTVAVQRKAYSTDGWGKVAFRLPPESLPPIPPFFRQDAMRPEQCEIVDASGGSRPATPAECAGLERSAVWGAVHVESRIRDHLAGRPNAFAESMKLKA